MKSALISALNRYSLAVQVCCQSLQMHNFWPFFFVCRKVVFIFYTHVQYTAGIQSPPLKIHCTVTFNMAKHLLK